MEEMTAVGPRKKDRVQQDDGTRKKPVYVTMLEENDVLLGRGTGPNDHVGNVRYRGLVRQALTKTDTSKPSFNAKVKNRLAREIVKQIYARNGRFVQKTIAPADIIETSESRDKDEERQRINKKLDSHEIFLVVDEKTAVEKTKQSFRHQIKLQTAASSFGVKSNFQQALARINENAQQSLSWKNQQVPASYPTGLYANGTTLPIDSPTPTSFSSSSTLTSMIHQPALALAGSRTIDSNKTNMTTASVSRLSAASPACLWHEHFRDPRNDDFHRGGLSSLEEAQSALSGRNRQHIQNLTLDLLRLKLAGRTVDQHILNSFTAPQPSLTSQLLVGSTLRGVAPVSIPASLPLPTYMAHLAATAAADGSSALTSHTPASSLAGTAIGQALVSLNAQPLMLAPSAATSTGIGAGRSMPTKNSELPSTFQSNASSFNNGAGKSR